MVPGGGGGWWGQGGGGGAEASGGNRTAEELAGRSAPTTTRFIPLAKLGYSDLKACSVPVHDS